MGHHRTSKKRVRPKKRRIHRPSMDKDARKESVESDFMSNDGNSIEYNTKVCYSNGGSIIIITNQTSTV